MSRALVQLLLSNASLFGRGGRTGWGKAWRVIQADMGAKNTNKYIIDLQEEAEISFAPNEIIKHELT